jgi:hypothetical protein
MEVGEDQGQVDDWTHMTIPWNVEIQCQEVSPIRQTDN